MVLSRNAKAGLAVLGVAAVGTVAILALRAKGVQATSQVASINISVTPMTGVIPIFVTIHGVAKDSVGNGVSGATITPHRIPPGGIDITEPTVTTTAGGNFSYVRHLDIIGTWTFYDVAGPTVTSNRVTVITT